jgi:hypothetical protein
MAKGDVRGSAARVLVPALVVLGLVGFVAIASTSSSSGGTNEVRPPSEALADFFFSFMIVLLFVSLGLVIYALTERKAIAAEVAKGRHRRSSFIGFAVFMFAFTLLAYLRLRDWKSPEFVDELGEQPFPRGEPRPTETQDPGSTYDPQFTWVPVLIVVAVIASIVSAWYVAERRERRRRLVDEDAVAEALALVLDDALDDLRAETDPRNAVIAAYARLERVLAVHRLGRRPSEAPQEYLNRILPRLELERGSVRRLTDLFMRAKFSDHEVDARMKDDAIEALTTVRDELRAAEERRRAKALASLETAVERP